MSDKPPPPAYPNPDPYPPPTAGAQPSPYGPPPGAYSSPPPPPPAPLIVAATPQLRQQPVQMECPHCRQHITTSVQLVKGSCMWVAVVVLLFVCICCAWIPCMMDDLMDAHHSCPNCKRFIGTYQKM